MRIRFIALLAICSSFFCIKSNSQTLVQKNIGATTPLAWGDYDNDGDMDLLQYNGTGMRILKNNLVGTTATFSDAGITLANVNPGSVGWVDIDNDTYIDVYYVDGGSLKFFINNAGVSFTALTANVAGETITTVGDWGDIDNDGDQDMVGGGLILINLGNNRFEVSQRLGNTGRTEFMDFDNDEDLDFVNRDFLYTNKGQGFYELDKTISPYGSDANYEYVDLRVMENSNTDQKTFGSIYKLDIGFQGYITVWNAIICGNGQMYQTVEFIELADFDNDGKKDVLIYENGAINLYSSKSDNCLVIAALAVPNGRSDVTDFDKDGDLDVFIGDNVFENTTTTGNAGPSVPANLNSSVVVAGVNLSWARSTDDKTPQGSLTYNLVVRRGTDVIFTEGIGTNGRQVQSQPGNVGFNRVWSLRNLPMGKYTWSVQAVDESFKTSAFAAEQSFEVLIGPVLTTTVPIPATYTSTYDDINDRYLLTYLKSGDLMGFWADGKTVQPVSEFKINTALSSASSHVVGFNPAKNEFMVSWISVSGNDKKIYAKNILASGSNLHAEKLIYSVSDTLKVFLGGDKVTVDQASGKYMVPFLHSRTDLSRPRTRLEDQVITYYPFGLMDVFGLKFSSNATTITAETPKLIQTKGIPDLFITPQTRNYSIESAAEFDSKRKMYCVAWNFLGEWRKGYGGGSSGEITSVLIGDDVKLIVTDENLVTKHETSTATDSPRNLKLIYNPLSEQFLLVWAQWRESTNGSGSDDYKFEIYQQIFTTLANGTLDFKNNPTIVSKPPDILNYGSGLPGVSWSRKRNEYLIVWNKGIAGGSIGVLGEGDLYWRRINPVTFGFVDDDTRSLSPITGNNSVINYNSKRGHFLLGWRSGSKNNISSFNIPKDSRPRVKSITPIKAKAGEQVTITGNRFGNISAINKVFFGTTEATIVPLVPAGKDSVELHVLVPPGLSRDKVPVRVFFDDQESNTDVLFENISSTGVTSVSPLIGVPGDVITINGTNFPEQEDQVSVKFDDIETVPTDIVSSSPTEIKVKIPTNAERGSGQEVNVVIQGLNNLGTANFRVMRVPLITSVEPSEGTEFTSTKKIRIVGDDFSDNVEDIQIKFGDVVVPVSDIDLPTTRTVLNVKVPLGAEGDLKVSVAADDTIGFSQDEYHVILGSEVRTNVKPSEFRFNKDADDNIHFKMEVYNQNSVEAVTFKSKGISDVDGDWSSDPLTDLLQGNIVEFDINESAFTDDPIGLIAYYEIQDLSGIKKESEEFRIYKNFVDSANTIPNLKFGGNVSDYNIISIPYELQINKITTVFKDLFNEYGYDKSKWRIFHYKNEDANETNDKYAEYADGLDDIDPGKGYWLITRYQNEISFEAAKTLNVDAGFYPVFLNPGWNQIGNPFNFDISWDDVRNANDGLEDAESFKTFRNGAFEEVSTIEKFRGGFVFYNGAAQREVKIPANNKNLTGGRVKERLPSDLAGKEWRVVLELAAGEVKNNLTSFGMHPQSLDGLDPRDEHRLPAFIQNLDATFPGSLSASVVPTNDNYSWTFDLVNTTGSNEVTLRWDNSAFGNNDRELFLHDRAAERLINMRAQREYTFTYREGQTFAIHFGDMAYVERNARPEQVVLSDAYPNPMSKSTRIPFTVVKDKTHVQLSIYSMQGREISTLVNEELPSGYYEYEWDGKSSTGETISGGVVMYRLQTSLPSAGVRSVNKKLIIAP